MCTFEFYSNIENSMYALKIAHWATVRALSIFYLPCFQSHVLATSRCALVICEASLSKRDWGQFTAN